MQPLMTHLNECLNAIKTNCVQWVYQSKRSPTRWVRSWVNRISPSEYEFVDLDLTPADLIVLGVAAQVWDEAVLSTTAQSALRKIEAKYGKSVVKPPAELSGLVRLQAHDISLPILLRAAREKRVVKFDYQDRSGVHSARSIEPWAVMCRQGNWYCIGFDTDREEQRTFKLPRIQGNVTLTAQAHSALRPETPTMELPPAEDQITAKITVAHNRGAMLRRNAVDISNNPMSERAHCRWFTRGCDPVDAPGTCRCNRD